MKIATWNVNSIRVRLPQVLEWLSVEQPDVLCLQETKIENAQFPANAFKEAGWESCYNGQKTYNGVALISKLPPEEIHLDLPGYDNEQKRLIGGNYQGLWVFSTYVPNGESLTSPKFPYKLGWLEQFSVFLKERTHLPMVVAGDFNIAPDERDVYDPTVWSDRILVSDEERAAFQKLCAAGYSDGFRLFDQPENIFSWWDYRTHAFKGNRGLRIDVIMVSNQLSSRCQKCWIDKDTRAAERPSDHAPVVLDIEWP